MFALTPNRALLAAKVASNNRVRQEFMTVIRELIGGSIRILVSSTEHTHMEVIGGGPSLYGLTAIFPWAIDLLSRCPNCLMMDGTFNCCRPYVMIVLHAIFANESIPIALALSPSETTDSYVRLYRHLSEVRKQFPETIDETLPSSIQTHDVVFVENHSPHAIDRNGEDVGDMPERTSFENVRDVAEPEEDPITSVDDQEARDEVVSETGRHPGLWDFLISIPLVTDQGTALRSFVRRFGLTWKLCHRHIIESVGANAPIGFWVSQILRCYCIEEYNFVRGIVLQQMATLEGRFPKEGSAFDTLQRLLGNLRDGHPLCDMCTWALWERLGCPRTTNSIESVHGHLNFDVRGRDGFIERLVVVIGHLRRRYETRNEWRDRSLQRHAEDCFPSQNRRTRSVLSEARQRYFVAMHNAFALTRPVRRVFPSEDRSHMIMPSCETQLTDAKLPSSWVVSPTTAAPTGTVVTAAPPLVIGVWVSFIPSGTTQVLDCMYVNTSPDGTLFLLSPTGGILDHVPRSRVTFLRHRDEGFQDLSMMLPLHRARTMGNRELMIWDLAWRYHCRYGRDFWARHGADIFTRFVELAARWKPERPAGPLEPFIMPNTLPWEGDCAMYVAELRGDAMPGFLVH
jgi:hypothetical protein